MYCLSNKNYNENKIINQENFMNFVAVAIVSAIVLDPPFNKESSFDWFKSHSPLFNNSSQITKMIENWTSGTLNLDMKTIFMIHFQSY